VSPFACFPAALFMTARVTVGEKTCDPGDALLIVNRHPMTVGVPLMICTSGPGTWFSVFEPRA